MTSALPGRIPCARGGNPGGHRRPPPGLPADGSAALEAAVRQNQSG